jgi:hypothetical protein
MTTPDQISAAWVGRAIATVFVLAGIYAGWVALTHLRTDTDPGTWLLPLSTGALCILLGGGVALTGSEVFASWREVGNRGLAVALLLLYGFILLPFLGFLAGSVVLVIAVGGIYAANRIFVVAGGLVLAVAMWALFAYALLQPLPAGFWQ